MSRRHQTYLSWQRSYLLRRRQAVALKGGTWSTGACRDVPFGLLIHKKFVLEACVGSLTAHEYTRVIISSKRSLTTSRSISQPISPPCSCPFFLASLRSIYFCRRLFVVVAREQCRIARRVRLVFCERTLPSESGKCRTRSGQRRKLRLIHTSGYMYDVLTDGLERVDVDEQSMLWSHWRRDGTRRVAGSWRCSKLVQRDRKASVKRLARNC